MGKMDRRKKGFVGNIVAYFVLNPYFFNIFADICIRGIFG
jgi:hypothetical protein